MTKLRHMLTVAAMAMAVPLAAVAAEEKTPTPETMSLDELIARRAAAYALSSYGPALTGVIEETVARWDGEQTARTLELFVGKDLQFIRINGSVVGALAGLAIHGVATLFL